MWLCRSKYLIGSSADSAKSGLCSSRGSTGISTDGVNTPSAPSRYSSTSRNEVGSPVPSFRSAIALPKPAGRYMGEGKRGRKGLEPWVRGSKYPYRLVSCHMCAGWMRASCRLESGADGSSTRRRRLLSVRRQQLGCHGRRRHGNRPPPRDPVT